MTLVHVDLLVRRVSAGFGVMVPSRRRREVLIRTRADSGGNQQTPQLLSPGQTAQITAEQFGMPGDKPVPGNYDGVGGAEFAVVRAPATDLATTSAYVRT